MNVGMHECMYVCMYVCRLCSVQVALTFSTRHSISLFLYNVRSSEKGHFTSGLLLNEMGERSY